MYTSTLAQYTRSSGSPQTLSALCLCAVFIGIAFFSYLLISHLPLSFPRNWFDDGESLNVFQSCIMIMNENPKQIQRFQRVEFKDPDRIATTETLIRKKIGPKTPMQRLRSKDFNPRVPIKRLQTKDFNQKILVQRLQCKGFDPKTSIQRFQSKGSRPITSVKRLQFKGSTSNNTQDAIEMF